MENALVVGNTFLEISVKNQRLINRAQLNKMMYLTAVDYGIRTNRNAFHEYFMAWPYGPVLGSIHEAFFDRKHKFIQDYIKFGGSFEGEKLTLSLESPLRISIEKVWNLTNGLTTTQIMQLTMNPNSAWHKAMQSDSLILDPSNVQSDRISLMAMVLSEEL